MPTIGDLYRVRQCFCRGFRSSSGEQFLVYVPLMLQGIAGTNKKPL
jgi:hypothetical protein